MQRRLLHQAQAAVDETQVHLPCTLSETRREGTHRRAGLAPVHPDGACASLQELPHAVCGPRYSSVSKCCHRGLLHTHTEVESSRTPGDHHPRLRRRLKAPLHCLRTTRKLISLTTWALYKRNTEVAGGVCRTHVSGRAERFRVASLAIYEALELPGVPSARGAVDRRETILPAVARLGESVEDMRIRFRLLASA